MTNANRYKGLAALGRTALLVLFLFGIILSGRFADLWDGAALIFVIGGTLALTLMGFSLPQIRAAIRKLAGRPFPEEDSSTVSWFWEAAGRNFWILGVLGSVVSFVLNLVQAQGGIQDMAFRLASSFRPAVFGLVLGILCGLPALKCSLDGSPSKHPDQAAWSGGHPIKALPPLRVESAVGLLLMLAILFWNTVFRLQQNPTRNFPPLSFFLDWPAVLVVVGGTFVVTILLAPTAWGASVTLASALVGAVSGALGIIKVMLAVSHAEISNVAGSIAFIISSCFLTLLIMVLAGIPLSDREKSASRSVMTGPLLRLAWYVFPLLVFVLLVLAFIMVVTPFQKQA